MFISVDGHAERQKLFVHIGKFLFEVTNNKTNNGLMVLYSVLLNPTTYRQSHGLSVTAEHLIKISDVPYHVLTLVPSVEIADMMAGLHL